MGEPSEATVKSSEQRKDKVRFRVQKATLHQLCQEWAGRDEERHQEMEDGRNGEEGREVKTALREICGEDGPDEMGEPRRGKNRDDTQASGQVGVMGTHHCPSNVPLPSSLNNRTLFLFWGNYTPSLKHTSVQSGGGSSGLCTVNSNIPARESG